MNDTSSLVNAIFGDPNLVEVGSGNSVTKNTTKIEGNVDCEVIQTKRPFIIHDIKGLESGTKKMEQYVSQTKSYLETQTVHIVWFVVSSGQQRFLDTDIQLITNIYSKYPGNFSFLTFSVIIVLNKIDQLPLSKTIEFENAIRDILLSEKCKNVKGIVKTCANIYDKDQRTVHIVNECSKCQSKKILIDSFDKEYICQSCNHTEDCSIDNGLTHLVNVTSSLLPEIASNIFICEQKVDLILKDQYARRVISDAYYKARSDWKDLFFEKRVQFIVTLGEIFGMDESGRCFSQKIFDWFHKQVLGKEKMSQVLFKIFDYLERIFTSMTSVQMIVACEGMFWYYFFKKNYMKHLGMVMEIETENYEIYDRYFQLLQSKGIDATLDIFCEDLQKINMIF